MKNSAFSRALCKNWWFPLLGAVIGVIVEARAIVMQPAEYVAIGKVLAGRISVAKVGMPDSSSSADDPRVTHVEILRSQTLRDRTKLRIAAMYPELHESAVNVNVKLVDGSSVLVVRGIGAEPKYTKAYLSCLLDEYLVIRREMVEATIESSMVNKVIEQVLRLEKTVIEKHQAFEQFKKSYDLELLATEHSRLVQLVSILRGEVERLVRSGDSSDEITNVKEALSRAERELGEISARRATAEQLKVELDNTLEDYKDWKKRLDRIDATQTVASDAVAIMERPQAAIEQAPDLLLPLSRAAAFGAGIGVVLMLAIGLGAQIRVKSSRTLLLQICA